MILFEKISCLFQRESLYVPDPQSSPILHIENRCKIIMWFYKVVDYFDYDREIVAIAIEYIDRFLLLHRRREQLSSQMYKIVAMTCLYLAIKLHLGETHSVSRAGEKNFFSLEQYIKLNNEFISTEDITNMELCVLSTLSWKVNPVSPMCFVRYFLMLMMPTEDRYGEGKASSFKKTHLYDTTTIASSSQKMCRVEEVLYKLAVSFAENVIYLPGTTMYSYLDRDRSSGNMSCRTFTSSAIAYASILLSMELISHSALPLAIRESFLRKCIDLSSRQQQKTSSTVLLHPDDMDVKEIIARIRKAVHPQTDGRHVSHIFFEKFPILTTAMQQGIMSSSFYRVTKQEEAYCIDSSPKSPNSSTYCQSILHHHHNHAQFQQNDISMHDNVPSG